MFNKKVLINAFSSSGQVIISGIVFFVLYRFLLSQLGAEQLGIWSLVLATTSIANLANFGITSGLVKFVAEYDAKNKTTDVHKLVFTAFVTIFCFFTALIVLIYLLADFIMSKIIAPQHLNTALKILPFSLTCLFINAIGGVYTSVLEGYQKNYQRNIIYTISTILLLVISYFFVPKFQLLGVAYAQILQSLFIFISAFVLSKKLYPSFNSYFKWNWDAIIFKQLLSYGSKFQAISICQMLFEPVTKSLLSKFGGLQMVAYYEMANKLVSQLRGLIVSANQIVVPVVAQAANTNTNFLKKLYTNSLLAITILTSLLITLIILYAPLISMLWLGKVEKSFVIFVYLISISNFFNIICGPAYFAFLGEGKLSPILIIHVIMALLNICLGYLLGISIPLYGVVIGWVLTFSLGSLLIIISYQRQNELTFLNLYTRNDLLILFSSFCLCGLAVFHFCLDLDMKFNIYTFTFYRFVPYSLVFIPILFFNKTLRTVINSIPYFKTKY